MFFSMVGRLLAALGVIFGAGRAAIGFYVASLDDPALAARYMGSGSPGAAIDEGLKLVIASIALGILTDISLSVRRSKDSATKQTNGTPPRPEAPSTHPHGRSLCAG